MKIILHGKNIGLTPTIKNYVDEKIGSLAKLFPNSNDDLIEARVEVGKPSLHHHEGMVFYAEANLKIGGKLIRAVHEDRDLYAAIDKVRDEVEVQIKKFKEKRTDSERKART